MTSSRNTPYSKLDAAILNAIQSGNARFIEIWTAVEGLAAPVTWVETTGSSTDNQPSGDGELYATHEGVFEIAGHKLRCYRLSNGMAVFNTDDFEEFFGDIAAPSTDTKA